MLDRKFIVAAPNQAWVGDVTYIATAEGWLFLAIVIDLFSRKVLIRVDFKGSYTYPYLPVGLSWQERLVSTQTGILYILHRQAVVILYILSDGHTHLPALQSDVKEQFSRRAGRGMGRNTNPMTRMLVVDHGNGRR